MPWLACQRRERSPIWSQLAPSSRHVSPSSTDTVSDGGGSRSSYDALAPENAGR